MVGAVLNVWRLGNFRSRRARRSLKHFSLDLDGFLLGPFGMELVALSDSRTLLQKEYHKGDAGNITCHKSAAQGRKQGD
jgi:hypothetical protein